MTRTTRNADAEMDTILLGNNGEFAENLAVDEDTLYCQVHTTVETTLRCNKCGRLMCATKCAVLTPVGYRCKQCVRGQQDVFYNVGQYDYLIAGGISFGLSLLANFVTPSLWIFLAIIGGPIAGTVIARIIHAAIRRRRGRYTGYVVVGGIAFGIVSALWPQLEWLMIGVPVADLLPGFLTPLLFTGIAAVVAFGWFRYGK